MELSGTGEVRRGGRVVSAKAPTEKREPAGLRVNNQPREDRLALSRQVVGYLEERNRQQLEQYREQEDGSAEERMLDLMDKALKAMDKCQKIFARVAAGDKVPPEDLRYLEKNDPEGFKLALAMRTPKKHPKEWKSVLDDEDRRSLDAGEEQSPGECVGGVQEAEGPALD